LNLDGKTVRRYLRAATADELLTEIVPESMNSTNTSPTSPNAGNRAAPTRPR
jgi:hypothetical protein